eukprot:Opistho-2@41378
MSVIDGGLARDQAGDGGRATASYANIDETLLYEICSHEVLDPIDLCHLAATCKALRVLVAKVIAIHYPQLLARGRQHALAFAVEHGSSCESTTFHLWLGALSPRDPAGHPVAGFLSREFLAIVNERARRIAWTRVARDYVHLRGVPNGWRAEDYDKAEAALAADPGAGGETALAYVRRMRKAHLHCSTTHPFGQCDTDIQRALFAGIDVDIGGATERLNSEALSNAVSVCGANVDLAHRRSSPDAWHGLWELDAVSRPRIESLSNSHAESGAGIHRWLAAFSPGAVPDSADAFEALRTLEVLRWRTAVLSPRARTVAGYRAADYMFRIGADPATALHVWVRGQDEMNDLPALYYRNELLRLAQNSQRAPKVDADWNDLGDLEEGKPFVSGLPDGHMLSRARVLFRVGPHGPFAEGIACGFGRRNDPNQGGYVTYWGSAVEGIVFPVGRQEMSPAFVDACAAALCHLSRERAFGVVSIAASLVFGSTLDCGKVVPGRNNFVVDERTGRPQRLRWFLNRAKAADGKTAAPSPSYPPGDLLSALDVDDARFLRTVAVDRASFRWPPNKGRDAPPFWQAPQGTRRRETEGFLGDSVYCNTMFWHFLSGIAVDLALGTVRQCPGEDGSTTLQHSVAAHVCTISVSSGQSDYAIVKDASRVIASEDLCVCGENYFGDFYDGQTWNCDADTSDGAHVDAWDAPGGRAMADPAREVRRLHAMNTYPTPVGDAVEALRAYFTGAPGDKPYVFPADPDESDAEESSEESSEESGDSDGSEDISLGSESYKNSQEEENRDDYSALVDRRDSLWRNPPPNPAWSEDELDLGIGNTARAMWHAAAMPGSDANGVSNSGADDDDEDEESDSDTFGFRVHERCTLADDVDSLGKDSLPDMDVAVTDDNFLD